MASYNLKIEERRCSQRPITLNQSNDEQVSVIRKEFVALTGDHFSAVVLNQLLYWTLRVKDFDLYLEEEKAFGSHYPESHEPFHHGWIYKTATDLSEETMLGISKTTMRKYLKVLIDQGWLEERANSFERWKKTTQYRVNIRKLQADLIAIGRQLPGGYLKAFSTVLGEEQPHKHLRTVSSNNNASSLKNHLKSEEISKSKILPSKTEILSSKTEILPSYTYTETTPKTTNKEHTQRAGARVVFNAHSESGHSKSELPFLKTALDLWKLHVGQEVSLTEERKQKLHFLFVRHFQKDLGQWERFCERVGSSPFLMGEGPRKWRVSFDWILCEGNLLKVREGNFDNPEALNQKVEKVSEATRTNEIHAILASIEDPLWREWCSHLDLSPESRNSVSLGELKEIANARFLEIEDDRLVWIESPDKRTLDCIENLRMKMLSLIQKTFPNTRNLRTRLKETLSDRSISNRKEPSSSLKDIKSLSETVLAKIGHSNPTHSQQRSQFKGTHLMKTNLMTPHLMGTHLIGETHA